ncbi:MAG TPA: hypothetical protein VF533_13735 [Solirubrobacteraceae bacterium]
MLVQVDDVAAARARAAQHGVRTVWQIDLPDIRASHLHPADTGGTILSVDEPRPPESWRWGGPDCAGRVAQGRVRGVTIAVPDPAAAARRWAALLGTEPDAAGDAIPLGDGQSIAFARGDGGLVDISVAVPEPRVDELRIGAARIRLTAL